ncbi:MAG: hypothetical protein EA422_07855 [Gemmatimonadales bacterium]|nr:MAG: hypothetical protein EA422_07855 [Gemmatimonadales bacterium]
MRRIGGWLAAGLVLLLGGMAAGCELGEITVAEPEDLLVVEIYLRVVEDRGEALAIVHWSGGREARPTTQAEILLRRGDGVEVTMPSVGLQQCMDEILPEDFFLACFRLAPGRGGAFIRPGERYDAVVTLPSGERLEGRTTVPGDFQLISPSVEGRVCGLPGQTLLPMHWTPSRGVWAYVPEVELSGLREALEPEGIPVETDPLILLGLALSEEDTSIVFPTEFGLFQRFSDEAEVLLALRDGAPEGVRGRFTISALDRNGTNWSRGGNFNPSGPVRIPSLFGDGTGVLGAVVVRELRVEVDNEGQLPPCLPGAG